MFEREEVPSAYIEDYKTLHHDIGLVRRSGGSWDLWFGQDEISKNYQNNPYLDIIDGDIVSAKGLHSLQVGIIIACLTSWNYLNRTGNPIYTEFGNESYSLLKKNKGTNTKYKIKQFFIDCLNRMRRVYSVESLEVYDIADNPYMYKVIFKVISITNSIVDGEFYLDTDSNRNSSVLDIRYNHAYTSVSNPLFVECTLKNEYGAVIEGEVIYIYIKNDNDSDFKFYGITEATDYNGVASVTIPPKGLSVHTQIMFVFKGNSLYNPSISKIVDIESVAYYIKSRYTYKTIEDEFRLGELLSDYVFTENMSLSDFIPIEDINEYTKDIHNKLEYDENEKRKLYLILTNHYIEGTNKRYYDAYSWKSDGSGLILSDEDIDVVIYKQILYVEDSLGNSRDKFRLGELLSDYISIDNIILSNNIPIEDINENLKDTNNKLVYDKSEKRKLYLIPTNHYIEGTNKRYYDAYSWKSDGSGLILSFSRSINTGNVQLNTDNENEVHFLIDDGDNGLFEIDFDDGHLYYQVDLFDNEY